MLAKKKETAAATAVPPQVTDVTKQPSSSKFPTPTEYVMSPTRCVRKEKLIKVPKYVRRKF